MRVRLGGAEVDLLHRDRLLELILGRLADADQPLVVAWMDLGNLRWFASHPEVRSGADWVVLPRSGPLQRAARRVTGVRWDGIDPSDVVADVLATAMRARARVGFVGGTSGEHESLRTLLGDRYPSLELAGTWAPRRAELDDPTGPAALAATVADARTDLLVAGLGTPRQERWLADHQRATGARVSLAVGSGRGLVGLAEGSGGGGGVVERLVRLVREPGRALRTALVDAPTGFVRLRSDSAILSDAEARPAPAGLATPADWRRRFVRLFVALDAGAIALASLIAYLARNALGELGVVQPLQNEVPVALAVLPLWLAILGGLGCYRPEHLNVSSEALRRFGAGAVGGLFSLGFVSFALNLQLSRLYVLLLFALVMLLGTASRVFAREYLRRQRRRGRLVQNVLVAGADDEAVEVARALSRAEVAGYRVVGFLDDELEVGATVVGDLRVVGATADVLDVAYDLRAGLVLVSPTGVRPGTLSDLTVLLEGSPIGLAVAPSLFEVVSRRVTVESVANVPVLHVRRIRLGPGKAAVKRAIDLVLATILLVLLTPLMVGAAIAVRSSSRGSALFRQTRVGRDGRRFTMLKFRTMVADAEDRLVQVAELNEAGHRFFKIREDPRVTRVGRFLRKWSIDETPQLFNVLRGQMSLVGPRPPLPSEVEKYEPWHLRRLRVKPGLTGVWQVSGRSNVPFEEAVKMDLFYIENWSVGYDLTLLGRTVLAVFGRQGAW